VSPRLRFALLMAALLALGGCAASSGPSAPPASAARVGSAGAATFDREFIDMMVPHHEAAIEMAELAVARAERPEIQAFARDLVLVRQDEIDHLRDWRHAWFGSAETPPTTAVPMLPGMPLDDPTIGETVDLSAAVDRLEGAAIFDQAFLKEMIAHHEVAVAAGKLGEQQATQPELRQLAGEIVATQQIELTDMKAWLEAGP
jgi:uncharacterized protein (DUF305 family)